VRIIGRRIQRGLLDEAPGVRLGVFNARVGFDLCQHRAHLEPRERARQAQHIDVAVEVVPDLHVGASVRAQALGALCDRGDLHGGNA
jgi:hypothetical protein